MTYPSGSISVPAARAMNRNVNTVERVIGRLKRYRAASTRYDKLAIRYEATIQIAIILDLKPSS
ncbi:transposase [Glycomyces harbinensis]|nr:transposase [Glycomyces harbinensis]